MPNPSPQAVALAEALALASGQPISPEAGQFGACFLQATLAAAPMFLQAFVSCMAGTPTPPPSGYDPGNRPRCS